jgi:uncharacterized protein YdeI (YjbR/CyaY-like superfamily)
VDITETLGVKDRAAWRQWLSKNSPDKTEIWLLLKPKTAAELTYIDAVYEAICFGWIDGIAKRYDVTFTAQRFTPRRKKSHWTELNKERARRLIAQGLMTSAGQATLPDLSISAFSIAGDIRQALQADPETWRNFSQFPALYQRVRVSYVEETRKQPSVFKTRLTNLLVQTKRNKMFGGME